MATEILYIEDNASNLVLVEELVKLHGHFKLISATDGKKGLEMAERHELCLIFLDYHLPEISGDNVLIQLKKNPRTSGIPVYMLSADVRTDQIRKLKSLGAVDYITKPIDVQKFLSILDEHASPPQDASNLT